MGTPWASVAGGGAQGAVGSKSAVKWHGHLLRWGKVEGKQAGGVLGAEGGQEDPWWWSRSPT